MTTKTTTTFSREAAALLAELRLANNFVSIGAEERRPAEAGQPTTIVAYALTTKAVAEAAAASGWTVELAFDGSYRFSRPALRVADRMGR